MNINNLPIVVDLDETLILTDTLFESLLRLLRNTPWLGLKILLMIPFVSRSRFKVEVLKAYQLDPSLLPYNEELINYLKQQKAQGYKLVLASASNEKVVKSVADYLDIFNEYYGSSEKFNLKGKNKAGKLVELYGEGGFIYAGDSQSDIAVWSKASGAIVVGDAEKYARKAKVEVVAHFPSKNKLKFIVKQFRIYQWVKNVLVFVPLVSAGRILEIDLLVKCAICFFAFSLAASSAYVLNDLLDIDSDRQHPRKKERPFASGRLSLQFGMFACPALLLVSLLAAYWVDYRLAVAIFAYYALTTWYSFVLKTLPLVDIFTLAALYTLRVLAGSIACGLLVSTWLLSFSGCLFLSLAFLKRFTETDALTDKEIVSSRRGYNKEETQILMVMGIASAFAAVIVFSLWLDSESFAETYSNQLLIWMVLPLMLLWQCRMWLAASRGKMHDDPIVYTAKDRMSWLIFALCGLFYALGISI
jgi:4-hydroxybenzoate polyprenyltransferase